MCSPKRTRRRAGKGYRMQTSTTSPSAALYRFPARRSAVVWLTRNGSAWLVQAYGHGWTHGSSAAADADAQWMSRNLDLPIREVI
jgi:hypothetical protein